MPKGFLRLGDRPIIEESISRLLEVGVRHIVIVTGHIAGFYHALQARYPDVVQLVHNPYYAPIPEACIRCTVPAVTYVRTSCCWSPI